MDEIETRITHLLGLFLALQVLVRPLVEYQSVTNTMVRNYDLIRPLIYEQPELDTKLLTWEQQSLELEEDLRRTLMDVLNSPHPSRNDWTKRILALLKKLRRLQSAIRSARQNEKKSTFSALQEDHQKQVEKYLSRRSISAPDFKKLMEDDTDFIKGETLKKILSLNHTFDFKNFEKTIFHFEERFDYTLYELRNISEMISGSSLEHSLSLDNLLTLGDEHVDNGEDEDTQQVEQSGEQSRSTLNIQLDNEGSRPADQQQPINNGRVGFLSEVEQSGEQSRSTLNIQLDNEGSRPADQQQPINNGRVGFLSEIWSSLLRLWTTMWP